MSSEPNRAELEDQARELIRLAARLVRHVRARAEAVPAELTDLLHANGLASRHLHVLIALAAGGPSPVGTLARQLALAPASTSQLVNELLRAGLVTRRTDPDDRRRALIAIRDDLRPAVAGLAGSRLDPFRTALAQLSGPEREAFVRGWRLLVDAHDRQSNTPEKGTA
jgi:DNA-binding MarR family transcriptional regulator